MTLDKLENLKDGLVDLDDEIAERERIHKYKLEDLNKKFEDNKIKALMNAAKEAGKLLISQEDLAELKNALEKSKTGKRLSILVLAIMMLSNTLIV